MTRKKKILDKILSGTSDPNIQYGRNMMNIPAYELVIYWKEEDKAFIVEVPELPGCMADGETYESAVKNVQTVISEWIETAKQMGREISSPKGRLIYA